MQSDNLKAGSAAVAHETIDLMAQHGVPTTAPNYEVWLTHRIGSNPALSRQIEEFIVRGQKFTASVNEELFERYFSNTRLSAQMMETGECIARELAEVLDALKGGGNMTADYAGKLQDAASSFESSLEPGKLREVVMGLAAATREMARQSNDLYSQIQSSAQQVAALQSTLQVAESEARHDSLTGLANRRAFDQVLMGWVGAAKASGEQLSLIMCDIDHFKRFNDLWGHQVGDQVIRFIANVLQTQSPQGATPARYGGEEFSIILPGVSLADAHFVANAIRDTVRTKKLVRKSTQEQIGVVTLSMGVSTLRAGESAAELLARADSCLYMSKNLGRDRVTTESFSSVAA
ncbi:MAG: GGDEF domain-containing protein [Caulobacterales bacterium]